jgi:O-6-methylguanine DNA methyltransferase
MPNAAAARAEGFRPCKQCRPDEAAGSPGPPETIRYGTEPTPFGLAFLALSDRGIAALYLLEGDESAPGLARLRAERPGAELVEDVAAVRSILRGVIAFIYGDSPAEPDLPLDVRGTPFQRRVWDAIRAIPRGETRTYGAVAEELGTPGAARAVGSACGANPVSLLIPCHRVVRAGSGLGGYEWGLDRRSALLDLEHALPRS